MHTRITGYLFDIDGTLLDSRPAHTRAWQRTLAAHGILKTETEIHYDFSETDPEIARVMFSATDPALVNQISQEKNDFFLEEIPHIPLFPKVTELLARIYVSQIPFCFVSSNYDYILGLMMKVYGWDEISSGFVGIDAVTHAKPDPEMVNLAIKKIHRKPNECVMIGDSPSDIKAGKAAGTRTIAIASTNFAPESLRALQPDKILKGIGDLLPLLPLSLD
jgi:pyrophosphatase PpaX